MVVQVNYQLHYGSEPRSNSRDIQYVPPALLSPVLMLRERYNGRDVIQMVKTWESLTRRAELCHASVVLCKSTKMSEITL